MSRGHRIRRSKGFTLVELLVSLVLFMVLAGAVSSIILVGFNLYGRSVQKNNAQRIGNEVLNLLSNRLSYATALAVSNSAEGISRGLGDLVTEAAVTSVFVPVEGDCFDMGNTIPANAAIVTSGELQNLRLVVSLKDESTENNRLIGIRVEVLEKESGNALFSAKSTVLLKNIAADTVISEFDDGLLDEMSNELLDLYIGFVELG